LFRDKNGRVERDQCNSILNLHGLIYFSFASFKNTFNMGDPNQMSFLEHLEELRWRVIRAAIAILAFAVLAFVFKGVVFDQIILAPKNTTFITYKALCYLSRLLGLGEELCLTSDFSLQNIEMSGQFTSHLVVSIVAGIIISFPYVFYQIWSFIVPGLSDKERGTARGVVFFTSLLFMLGIAFGYFIVAPLSVQFLGSYKVSEQVENIITLNSFISTITTTTLASGLVFQLPIVVYFFAKLGIVTPAFLRTYRKHAIIVVLIVAAIITPPDITSQILVSMPLLVLYEISIYIAKVVIRNKEKT
jgi:sec-independent protein translocase protein TatC